MGSKNTTPVTPQTPECANASEVFDEYAESVIAGLRALVHQQNAEYQALLSRHNTLRTTVLQALGVDNE